jgi:tRNA pseudouridine38-40 synthase
VSTETVRLKLLLSYDGRPFDGWQSQRSGGAVQDHLERAIATIAGRPVRVHGASRTDAGVHALGQVAHADVPRGREPRAWVEAINGNLPPEVRVLRVTRVSKAFHARFSAAGKIYRYRVFAGQVLPPLEIGRVWHKPGGIDRGVLDRALRVFEGRHDFAAFCANRGKPGEDTVRVLHRTRLVGRGECYELVFEGEGFLYKMVRMLAAAAVRVAQGRGRVDDLERLLAEPGGASVREVAPACGLYLVRVLYNKAPSVFRIGERGGSG